MIACRNCGSFQIEKIKEGELFFSHCQSCGQRWKIEETSTVISSAAPLASPLGGAPVNPHIEETYDAESAFDPVKKYFSQIRHILGHPTEFFARMPLLGGLTSPLVFVLINCWIAAVLSHLMTGALGMGVGMEQVMEKVSEKYPEIESLGRYQWMMDASQYSRTWLMGAVFIMLTPFFTIIRIFFTSGLIYFASRWFISGMTPTEPGRSVTFESSTRIMCYSETPVLFTPIPFIGGMIYWLYSLVLTTIGVREAYKVTPMRAFAVAVFPYIFGFTLTLGVFLIAGVFFFILARGAFF